MSPRRLERAAARAWWKHLSSLGAPARPAGSSAPIQRERRQQPTEHDSSPDEDVQLRRPGQTPAESARLTRRRGGQFHRRQYRQGHAEHPEDTAIVVVDATFGHRIDQSERRAFEEAEAAGELVSPPAGAIGRGDRFLLQIADRTGATVLSNDSFQEFHGEYGWLFDEGRLLGAKPVQGVGWIFTPRTPVRGPKSRVAVQFLIVIMFVSLRRVG